VVVSIFVLRSQSPESLNSSDFMTLALEVFRRLPLLNGGLLSRLSRESRGAEPAVQVPTDEDEQAPNRRS
jgi:hypothetical protein